MSKIFKKILKYLIIIAIIGGGVWYFYPKNKATTYVTEKVKLGAVEQIVSITGSVESDSKISLHFQRGGKVTQVNSKVGNKVKASDLLASLDTSTLQIQLSQAQAGAAIANANLNLKLAGASGTEKAVLQKSIDSANIAYNASITNLGNTKKSADQNLLKAQSTLDNANAQYQNVLNSGNITGQSSDQTLTNSYTNAKSTINLAIIAMKNGLSSADSILSVDQTSSNAAFKNNLGVLNTQTLNTATGDYLPAKTAIAEVDASYNALLSNWDNADQTKIDDLLTKTESALIKTKTLLSDTYQMLLNTITSSSLTQTSLDTYKSNISTYETSASTNLASIQTLKQTIASAKLNLSSSGQSSKTSLDTARANVDAAQKNLDQTKLDNEKAINSAQADVDMKSAAIKQAQASYNDRAAKPRAVDIASLKAQVDQANAAINLAAQNIKDLQIFSPIDGVITEVNIDLGENLTGAENAVVVIGEKLKVKANVSETDITKIKLNNPVAVTFDALPLNQVFSAKIVEINPAETVVQGVIYYQAKIMLDQNNPEIKPGMTANLDITANKKENVLTVSPQAVQYKNKQSFVQVLKNSKPEDRNVEIGLEGNQAIEILSGVSAGEEVVLF
jgi:macrolide-specific efflux system membrane fusion protein